MRKLSTIGLGVGVIALSLFGTVSAANAATYHGYWNTKPECVYWQGVYELHGYSVSPCMFDSWRAQWFFTTP
jgi:hypothetical protein